MSDTDTHSPETADSLRERDADRGEATEALYDWAQVKADLEGKRDRKASEQRRLDRAAAECQAINELIAGLPEPDRKLKHAAEPGTPAHNAQRRSDGPARDRVSLARDESLAEHVGAGQPELSMRDLIRGLTWGTWSAEAQRAIRAQDSTSGSGGGFLVPTGLSTSVLDLARSKTQVLAAGAQTVDMPTAQFSIAKVASDPSASWRGESDSIAESESSFDKLTLVAKTLAALVKIPLELVEDTEGGGARSVEPLIRSQLAASVALELDRAALLGDGDGHEPVGLHNTAGVSTTSLSGSPADWDFVVDRAGDVEDNDFDVSAAITSPRVGRQLGKLKDANNQPMQRPERVDYPILESTQVPTDLGAGNDESLMFVGQWDQLLIGLRRNMTMFPLRERFMDTGEIGLVVWTRADVAVARTGAFSIEDAIT